MKIFKVTEGEKKPSRKYNRTKTTKRTGAHAPNKEVITLKVTSYVP